MEDGGMMPEVFMDLCRFFDHDALLVYPDMGPAISAFLSGLDRPQLWELHRFLSGDLLQQPAPVVEQAVNSCGTGMMLDRETAVGLMRMVAEGAEAKLAG